MRQIKNRKAFTIIEMVIVIAVIAILSTVLVPTISGIIQKANHSADTQFAASLNIQLAMWQVDMKNGNIESEADLQKAIDEFYGSGFYASLKPKSGAQGYHYWWDVANQQVVLNTYMELVDTNGDGVAPTAAGTLALTFSPASPRSLILNTDDGEKAYFLMDHGGSALADYLVEVNNIAAVGDHATIIGNIGLIEDDAALADLIADKLEITAIANDYGMFFDNGTATYVYIPADAVLLGEANVRGDLSGVTEIYLPDGVKLGSNSLEGFTVTGTDYMLPDTWVGSTVIYANLAADQVPSFVSTNAFDCVLEIPTGERYVFVGGQLKRLGSNDSYSTSYSTALKSFVVTGTDNEKADMHFGAVNEIHYAVDYTGTFTLQVQDFVDENGACPARPVTWEGVGDAVANADGSITLTNAQLKAATTIVVRSTDGVEYTFNVKAVAVDGVSLKVNNVSNVSNQFSFEYNSTGVTYTLAATVYVTDNITCVKPSITPVISIDGILTYGAVTESEIEDESGNAAYQYTTTLSFINSKQTGDVAANLSVTAGSESRTGTISLKDTIQTAFVIADNANTQTKYGVQFTVGTVNTIRLDTLFAPATSDALNGRTEISYTATIGSTPLSSGNSLTAESWKSTTLDLSSVDGNGTLTVVINDGLKSTTFTATVKAGVYNVSTPEQWTALPNNVSVAIIKPFKVADTNFKVTAAMKDGVCTGPDYNSKCVGSATVYGNYNKISFGTFLIKAKNSSTGSNNYFIYLTSGKLNNVVIEGPVYGTVSTSWKDTNGYYVAGVEVAGNATISNSYISGFRSPLRVDGNSPTIKDSVLVGGAFANIYVANATEIKLTNVDTIQYKPTGGVVGGGIFLDSKANNSGNGVKITATNLNQYNYLDKNEMNTMVKSFSGTSIDISGTAAPLLHGDDYHIGIIVWEQTEAFSSTWASGKLDTSSNIASAYTAAGPKEGGNFITGKRKVTVYGFGDGGNACTHTKLPVDKNGNAISAYTSDHFLDAIGK